MVQSKKGENINVLLNFLLLVEGDVVGSLLFWSYSSPGCIKIPRNQSSVLLIMI